VYELSLGSENAPPWLAETLFLACSTLARQAAARRRVAVSTTNPFTRVSMSCCVIVCSWESLILGTHCGTTACFPAARMPCVVEHIDALKVLSEVGNAMDEA
jgi:hypothetical protein